MSRVLKTTAAGVLVAFVATMGVSTPSFAAAKKMSSHKKVAARHTRRAKVAAAPGPKVVSGVGNPFNDGDIFGGNGTVRQRPTFGTAAQYGASYGGGDPFGGDLLGGSGGGLLGGGGVLGTGVGGGNGVLGTGVLDGQGALGLGILGL